MRAQGVNGATLAKRVGVTQGAISRFFNADQASSVLVPRIFAALGVSHPGSDEHDEIEQLLGLLTEKQRDAVLRFIRELVEAQIKQ